MNIYNSEYTKNHRVVYFKWMNYKVCELYISKAIIKKISIIIEALKMKSEKFSSVDYS